MRQRVILQVFVIVLIAACAPGQAGPPTPMHGRSMMMVSSAPFDPGEIYRAMGFVVDSTRLRFVGSLRFVAAPTPDSTLAVFAMSLANRALSFRSQGSDYVAEYHVDLEFRADSGALRQVARDETVRVHSVQETQRSDESIIFQEFVAVRPGIYRVTVVLGDQHSPAHAQQTIVDTVPRLQGPGLGNPIPIYQGKGRTQLARVPQFIVNPRATTLYGSDSLRFYVEGYRLRAGTRLAARLIDQDSVEFWRDTVALSGDGTLGNAQFVIRPGVFPPGRGDFQVDAIGGAQERAPFLVSFADPGGAVSNFDQLLGLLRYFERQDLVAKLRAASRAERAAAWREFNRASDPTPLTPENEALIEYFHRVQTANRRYAEPGSPGWLTDRGQVLITLGEPERAVELGGNLSQRVRWEYTHPHLSLVFEDKTLLGQYRLTAESRADFEAAVATLRKTS